MLLSGSAAGLHPANPLLAAELPILQAVLRSLDPADATSRATTESFQQRQAEYLANDTTPGDSTPGDSSSGDNYPIPPGGGPAQREEVGLRQTALALLLPLRNVPVGSTPGDAEVPPTAGPGGPALPGSNLDGLIRELSTTAGMPQRNSGTGSEEDRAQAYQVALGTFLDLSTAWDPHRELGETGDLLADDSSHWAFAPPAAGAIGAALEGQDSLHLPPAAQTAPDDLSASRWAQAPATAGTVLEQPPGDLLPAHSPESAAVLPASGTRTLLRRVIPLLLVFNLGMAWKLGRDTRPTLRGQGRP
jgi:hypothetical protein